MNVRIEIDFRRRNRQQQRLVRHEEVEFRIMCSERRDVGEQVLPARSSQRWPSIPLEQQLVKDRVAELRLCQPGERCEAHAGWALVSLERLTKQYDALFDVSFPPGAMEREGS